MKSANVIACLFSTDNPSPREPKLATVCFQLAYLVTVSLCFPQPCWCTIEVPQHDGSILDSVNLCIIFTRISEV